MNIQEAAKKKLAEYKRLIDQDIAAYSKTLKEDIFKKYNQTTQDIAGAYISILARGGKRLRGALTMHAYYMAGGKDEQLAIRAARAIEMIHAYLLIVDDIADRSQTRRGGLAAHELLKEYHQKQKLHGNDEHFGSSQAMHAALFGAHKAMEEVALLPMKNEQKVEMFKHLNNTLGTTIAGQISDIYNEAVREVSEEDVRQVLTWKTAYYSFVNPLQFGILLAGKDMKDFAWLKDYALHIGLAFQITDDILGIFADESESGKSTLDDLREGKVTLLVANTLKKANEKAKKQFLASFGKDNINREEQQEIKAIMQSSEALKDTKETAENEAAKAIFALSEAPEDLHDYVRFLDGVALYITTRSS